MSPALVLSITMAVFVGSLFHVVAGRRIWQWPLFLVASLLGYLGGFLAALAWGAEWLRIGDVPLLVSTLGALGMTSLAWFFSAPRTSTEPVCSNS